MPYMHEDDLKIQYAPDFNTYSERRALLASRSKRQTSLPSGFPVRAESRSVWNGDSLDIQQVTYSLTPEDLKEIDEALLSFKGSGSSLNEICTETFKLPTLSLRLRNLSREIKEGTGILILRGMIPDSYSTEDNVIMHAGICSHIAPLRGSQSGLKDQVFHVCNQEHMSIPDMKTNSTSHHLPFHTDDTDILTLYALETSLSGGEMLWASHGQIYNDLAENRPEVLRVLAKGDWPLQTAATPPDYLELPVLYVDEKGPFFWLARGNFTGTPRVSRAKGIPDISLEQADALDAVQFAAKKHAVTITPSKGEIYFANNFSVLHSRGAFKDDIKPDPLHPRGRRRHLLRLWLRDPSYGRRLTGHLKRRWDQVFDRETARTGRWLLFRDMAPDMISENLFKGNFPIDAFSSCSNN